MVKLSKRYALWLERNKLWVILFWVISLKIILYLFTLFTFTYLYFSNTYLTLMFILYIRLSKYLIDYEKAAVAGSIYFAPRLIDKTTYTFEPPNESLAAKGNKALQVC